MFAVVDCDNCFVSCERVFQPDLKGRPVVVLSNNDGCVVARSNEAKALGIKMGVPVFQIDELVRKYDVQIRSSNYILYADMSNRIMSILRQEVGPHKMEQYSIDEAFLTLDRMDDLREWAEALVHKIGKWTGMPVSIGIAPTRTLAKVATWFAKKYPAYHKVCIIQTDEQREKALQLLDVSEVWGVGRRGIDKMHYYGVLTAWDFTQRSRTWARQNFTVTGERTWRELRGESCIDSLAATDRKTICTSRSFDQMVTKRGEMEMYISNYAAHCAQKLRAQHSVCQMVMVFIETNRHRLDLLQLCDSRTVTLTTPASSTFEVTEAALKALRAIWRDGYQFKRAGVIVTGIQSDSAIQQDLFDPITPEQRQKRNTLSSVVDTINRRHGNDTIQLGVQQFPLDSDTGERKSFRDLIRHDHRSRCYTTDLDDILEVE